MELSQIVKVTIIRGNKSVTRAGFGVPMILSSEATFANEMRTYTSIDGIAADFATSTSVYKWAQRLFGQERKPSRIKVFQATAKVAQVVTVTPTAVDEFSYSVTINGVEFTFLSDGDATAAEIVTGLIAAINGGSEPVTASGTTTLILTADVAGNGFSYSVGTNLSAVLTTANNGVQEDLALAKEADNDWYCLLLTSRNADDQKNAAAWIESQRKIFIAAGNTAAILESGSDDVVSFLKAKNYVRTAFLWSGDQASGPEAAWAGAVLPIDPGGETWKFKTLAGITADDLTATQETQADTKNANIYVVVAGVSMTAEGVMVQGEFIDVIRFIDWLQAQMEENVFERLVSLPKIPFTNAGIAIVEAEMRKSLEAGIAAGGIASYELDIPDVSEISTADKQSRTLPDMKFNAVLAGAIHFVEIDGVVQV
jgi:hypothetical protein